MRSEVGIDPQSLSYGFLNEIMDNLCSDGVLRSDGIGCTKFNEGCTKRSKVGINPQSHPYEFQNEIIDHSCSDGGRENNRIGYTKFNNVSNFVKDVPTVPKCVPR